MYEYNENLYIHNLKIIGLHTWIESQTQLKAILVKITGCQVNNVLRISALVQGLAIKFEVIYLNIKIRKQL